MSKKYDGIARISVAGGIAAVGLALGGVAMANAADSTTSSADTPTTSSAAPEGFGHRGGPGGGDLAANLAEELGVSESKVSDALDAVREDLPAPERPAVGERPTPPTAEERAAHETAFAGALAGELDLTTAKVSEALAAIHAEHEVAHRSDLSSRLDDAVEAGDLTAADKASVLKAFDAGVLAGRGGR